MNILVIGCDQVGASLVRDLERIGHDISIIEKDSEQLKRLDAFDDYTFSGNALWATPPTRRTASGRHRELRRRGRRQRGRLPQPDGAQIAKSLFSAKRSSAASPTPTCRYSTTRLTNWTPSAPPSSPSRPCSVLSPNSRYHSYNEVVL